MRELPPLIPTRAHGVSKNQEELVIENLELDRALS